MAPSLLRLMTISTYAETIRTLNFFDGYEINLVFRARHNVVLQLASTEVHPAAVGDDGIVVFTRCVLTGLQFSP
jgi:hypothetical protein